MNANEVLANRAAEMLGEPRGTYTRVHPNDHVNMGQSTNDVFPTATRLALLLGAAPLVAAARALADAFARKADDVRATSLKTGRTHLQDAVPITLGQEFGGYAECIRRGAEDVAQRVGAAARAEHRRDRRRHRAERRRRLPPRSSCRISRATPTCRSTPASNLFRVTQSMGDVLAYSGAMRRLAVELGKIASDLRLLSMGPRAGLAEIALPAVQPGSSIMPGKVNPSVPEMVNQVCFQVIGCDTTIAMACEAGSARAERDDAGDRVERAARLDDPARGDEGAADALRRRHRRGRSACARAARPQHRDRDRAQPVHRLRGDRGDREGRR